MSQRLVPALLPALLIALLLGAFSAGPATAQSAFDDFGVGRSPPPEAPPEDDRDRPPDLRAYGEIAETYRASSALDATQRRVDRFRAQLVQTLERAPLILTDVRAALARSAPGGDPTWFAGLLAFLALLLGIGRAGALIFGVYVARPIFVRMQRPNPQGLVDKLPVLAARVAMTLVGLAIALIMAAAVGSGFYPEDDPAAVVTALIAFGVFGGIRLVDTLWRMMLAPFLPAYRIPVMSDRQAIRLYRWLYAGTIFGVISSAIVLWLDQLGLQPQSSTLLHIGVTTAEMALVLIGGWVNRRAIDRAILGGRDPEEATWLARASKTLWGPAIILFLAFAWVSMVRRMVMETGATAPPPLGVAFVVLIMGVSVYAASVYAVELWVRRNDARAAAAQAAAARARAEAAAPVDRAEAEIGEGGALARRDLRADGDIGDDGDDGDEGGGRAPWIEPEEAAPPPSRSGMRTYTDLARRVASLFALGASVWALLALTGGRELFADGSALDRAQDIFDILFVGYVIYHALRIAIDRKLEEEGGDEIDMEPGDEGGGASASSRLATLLPLIRNFVLILVIVSTVVFAAMELGVNVAPLFAGAGIVGLAIGFGAQTLVRDILSGAFFLIDDAFRKGEYIDIGDVKGTVEKISLRSFQLRHHLGALNTIPFGEIRYLTNFSRDWVMMKLPLRLTYDTDPEKVRKLIKKLGQQLLEHPTEGHKFLQPLKSQGVYMMEDSAMIIRVKYMTKPGDQWTTRKLVYSSIRELFEQEGIKFAHREVTVRIPELDKSAQGLTDAEMRAVGAAARRAVDDAEAERAGPRPVAVGDDR